MKNIKQISADIRDMGSMLLGVADDLDRIGAIDLSALAALLGGNVATPVVEAPKERKEYKLRVPKSQPGLPKRLLTRQEKDQIRLLWSQSNKNRELMVPQLSETYQCSQRQITTILFNNTQAAKEARHLSRSSSGS